MNEIITFFQQNGLWLTLIAIAGILILGILKYLNVFKKLEEKYRHMCYLVISVGLSIIGSCIYLACIGQFTAGYLFTLACAIFALNQTFYNIYDTAALKDLVLKFILWCKAHKKEIKDVADEIDNQARAKIDAKKDK